MKCASLKTLSPGVLAHSYKVMKIHPPQPETEVDQLGGWICLYESKAPKARNTSLAFIHTRRMRAWSVEMAEIQTFFCIPPPVWYFRLSHSECD